MFKYLRQLLDWSDDNWPEVLQNIRKARQVWGPLGKVLQREGAELAISETFYCTVIQVVVLFGV